MLNRFFITFVAFACLLELSFPVSAAQQQRSNQSASTARQSGKPTARVLLVPIDDRPAVTQFTEWIARIADVEVLMPPRTLLGRFTKPGDSEQIARWLLTQDLRNVDAAVISIDMLAYGGLMTSRTASVGLEKAQQGLKVLETLRARHPRLPVYAFNAVQRVALSATAANRSYRDKLARWAVLSDENARRANPTANAEYQRLSTELPASAIQDYLLARRRNLAINQLMLQFAKRGIINELLLLQDDAQPFGLHRRDQTALREQIKILGLSDEQAKLYNGADEGSSVLVSRAVLRKLNYAPRVRVIYSSEKGRSAVGGFEDQTISVSVERQTAASGARIIEQRVAGDAPPSSEQVDYTLYVNAPQQSDAEFQVFANQLVADVKSGQPVAVADVLFPASTGGADRRLIDKLTSENLLDKLFAYAAWNTAGNTIGTTVPHANMHSLAVKVFAGDTSKLARAHAAHLAFLLHRYIGDYAYHTVVRPQVNSYIRRTLRQETEELDAALYAETNARIEREMKTLSGRLFDEHFKNRTHDLKNADSALVLTAMRDLEVHLPWQRTFEVTVGYNLDYTTQMRGASVAVNRTSPRAASPINAMRYASDEEKRWVETTLESLTLRERIGQMIVVGALGEYKNFGSDKFKDVVRHIEETGVGGFVFYRGDANELAALTNEMQRRARVPLLIAADFERGLPMQIRSGTAFTHNMGVAAAGETEASFREGEIIAREMRALGVHWLFAPVADVVDNPANSMVNVRSFGEDPAQVARHVAAFVRGVKKGGALSTAKHFPGHGSTEIDSHITLPVMQLSSERLDKIELAPFKSAIEAGVDSIMTAHLALPLITNDRTPASLSAFINQTLLRENLNFDGIITTDSLGMGAITERAKPAESALLAIKAGADVALLPPDPRGAINLIEAAVGRGEISPEQINKSVRRILRAKFRVGLSANRFVDTNQVNRIVEHPESVKEADAVAERSLTLLRHTQALLPLDASASNKTMFLVFAGDKGDNEQGQVFQTEIQRRVKDARIRRIDERTTPDEYEKFLIEAARAESVVAATFVKRAALKGTVALPDNQAAFINRLLKARPPVAVIAFGSPYQLQQFPGAQTYLATFAVEDVAQRAAARALFGETAITGKSPVSLKGLFERGAGLRTKARTRKGDANNTEALPHN